MSSYLKDHDIAVRWAKANRALIARRFVEAIGAEAECVWDGCHNSITSRESKREALWVHPKGAVVTEGQAVVIPGSRGSFSYLVKPTGDGERHAWSLAQGAGRKWARSETRLPLRARPEENLHLWKVVAEEQGCFGTRFNFVNSTQLIRSGEPKLPGAFSR